jgi:hypothetical protein
VNQWRVGEVAPLGELIDVDLPPEELQRLARVDALLRAVAACDRQAAGLTRIEPRGPGTCARC